LWCASAVACGFHLASGGWPRDSSSAGHRPFNMSTLYQAARLPPSCPLHSPLSLFEVTEATMPPLDSCIRLPDPPRMSAPPLVSTRRPMPSTPQPPSSNVSSALLSPLDNQVAAVTTARRTHVRRPRNPFILFRCDFVKRNLVPASVERDHRNVSSIAGARWQQMSEEEKQPWKDLAAEEKIRHALEHPGYRYKPAARASGDSRKQRSKRGADDDPEKVRCREIARLIGDGIVGEQLKKVLSDASAALKAPQPAALTRRRSSSCPPLRFPRQISHTHHHPSSSFSTPCSNFLQPGNSYFSSPWEMSSYYYMVILALMLA